MIAEFQYALHSEDTDVLAEALANAGVDVTPELLDKVGQPFYEVTLTCTVDTETGKVEILSAVSAD